MIIKTEQEKLEARRVACRKWRAAHPEKQKAACNRWKKNNPGKQEALAKAYRLKYPNKTREWGQAYRKRNPDYSIRRYGITTEGLNVLLEAQENKCAICGKQEKLHVDHCHVTKKIRGLLCQPCNCALGLLGENFSTLIRAADYIRRS